MHSNLSCLPGDTPDNEFPTVHTAFVKSVSKSEPSYSAVARSQIPTFDILNLQTKQNSIHCKSGGLRHGRSLKLKIQRFFIPSISPMSCVILSLCKPSRFRYSSV